MSLFDDRVQLLIELGYDGARFCGLQPQPGRPTAGGALRQRFADAGAEPKALCYAARTDAGVHARHNVATCWLWRHPAPATVVAEVARPRDDGLRDVRVRRVPEDVHARGIARGKRYRYCIADACDGPLVWTGAAAGDAWRVAPRLEVEPMQQAARHLVGVQDFSAMRAARCGAGTSVREVWAVEVSRQDGRIVIDVHGRSFLRNMVRILAGTLAEVGAGLRAPADVAAALHSGRRDRAGVTAPACGLTLERVETALDGAGQSNRNGCEAAWLLLRGPNVRPSRLRGD